MSGQKYNIQQYVYDLWRLAKLREEYQMLTTTYSHCRWSPARQRNVLADIVATDAAIRRYEDLPTNRGD